MAEDQGSSSASLLSGQISAEVPSSAQPVGRQWLSRGMVVASEFVIGLALLSASAPWLWLGALAQRSAPFLALAMVLVMTLNRRRSWLVVAAWLGLLALAWPRAQLLWHQGMLASSAEQSVADSNQPLEFRVMSFDARGWSARPADRSAFTEQVAHVDPDVVVVVNDSSALATDDAVRDSIRDLPGYRYRYSVGLRLSPARSSSAQSSGQDQQGRPIGAWIDVLARRKLHDWTEHATPGATGGLASATWQADSVLAGEADQRQVRLVMVVPPSLSNPLGFRLRHQLGERIDAMVVDAELRQAAVMSDKSIAAIGDTFDGVSTTALVSPAGWAPSDAVIRELLADHDLRLAGTPGHGVEPRWLPGPWQLDDSVHAWQEVQSIAAWSSEYQTISVPGHQRKAVLWTLQAVQSVSEHSTVTP